MDVAEAHLAEVGYRGISLEEVAREVGMTKPALYYHFPEGKEELAVAILHRSSARIRDGLGHAMGAADGGAGKLRAAARWLMAEPERGRPLAEQHDVLRFIDERHHAALAQGFHDAAYQPIRSVIAAAVASGEFRDHDPDFLTWSFLGLAAGLIDVQRLPPSELPVPPSVSRGADAADRLIDLFLRGALP